MFALVEMKDKKGELKKVKSSGGVVENNGMAFEKKNKHVKKLWFRYELITAVLTFLGLLTLCYQKI